MVSRTKRYWFVAECTECKAPGPMFALPDGRDRWAANHARITGHDIVKCREVLVYEDGVLVEHNQIKQEET